MEGGRKLPRRDHQHKRIPASSLPTSCFYPPITPFPLNGSPAPFFFPLPPSGLPWSPRSFPPLLPPSGPALSISLMTPHSMSTITDRALSVRIPPSPSPTPRSLWGGGGYVRAVEEQRGGEGRGEYLEELVLIPSLHEAPSPPLSPRRLVTRVNVPEEAARKVWCKDVSR